MVVGFYNFDGISVEGAIAAADKKRWANKMFIRACFRYVFEDLGCRRFVVRVESTNTEAYEMDKRLGFIEEGRLRQASTEGDDVIILGMLKSECPWLDLKMPEGYSNPSQINTGRLMSAG